MESFEPSYKENLKHEKKETQHAEKEGNVRTSQCSEKIEKQDNEEQTINAENINSPRTVNVYYEHQNSKTKAIME